MRAFERSQNGYTFWVSAASGEVGSRSLQAGGPSSSLWAARFGSGHEADPGASVARRSDIWKEVASRSGQCDPRDYQDDSWRDSSLTNSGGRLLFNMRTAITAELCTAPGKSLMLALQPPGIDDAIAMLAAGAGGWRKYRGGESCRS